jgi:DNA-binding GntR family transcriptional regulator
VEKKKASKYKELYQSLREQILKGQYLPGDILPSESELRISYHVTQPTIRHALDLLVKDRLGVGIISFEGHSVTSQNDSIYISTSILVGPEVTEWPEVRGFTPTKEELKSKVIVIERVRSLNGQVVFFERILIPNIHMKDFCKLDLNNTSLYDILRLKYEISIEASEQKMCAVAADKHMAGLIKVQIGAPIVKMERRLETNRSNFNIYSSLWSNTDNYMIYNYSR